jgi:hypothetical protein
MQRRRGEAEAEARLVGDDEQRQGVSPPGRAGLALHALDPRPAGVHQPIPIGLDVRSRVFRRLAPAPAEIHPCPPLSRRDDELARRSGDARDSFERHHVAVDLAALDQRRRSGEDVGRQDRRLVATR